MKLGYLLLGGILGLSGVAAAAYFSKKSFEDDHWNEICNYSEPSTKFNL